MRNPLTVNLFRCHAPRRDAPVTCPVCGRRVRRKARQQTFCSRRCRQRANYANRIAQGRFNTFATQDTALPTNPLENVHGVNALQAPKSWSSIAPERWRAVVEVEVWGGHRWQAVVSSDGVTCEVTELRPRALSEGGRS